jgi:hypothetical protein
MIINAPELMLPNSQRLDQLVEAFRIAIAAEPFTNRRFSLAVDSSDHMAKLVKMLPGTEKLREMATWPELERTISELLATSETVMLLVYSLVICLCAMGQKTNAALALIKDYIANARKIAMYNPAPYEESQLQHDISSSVLRLLLCFPGVLVSGPPDSDIGIEIDTRGQLIPFNQYNPAVCPNEVTRACLQRGLQILIQDTQGSNIGLFKALVSNACADATRDNLKVYIKDTFQSLSNSDVYTDLDCIKLEHRTGFWDVATGWQMLTLLLVSNLVYDCMYSLLNGRTATSTCFTFGLCTPMPHVPLSTACSPSPSSVPHL